MMFTYEKFKYCGVKDCKSIAYNECTCGGTHPDEIDGWANPPSEEKLEKHPKFLCDKHIEDHEE